MGNKNYSEPTFVFIRNDAQNKVFFAASGTPGGPSLTGGISTMSRGTNSEW